MKIGMAIAPPAGPIRPLIKPVKNAKELNTHGFVLILSKSSGAFIITRTRVDNIHTTPKTNFRTPTSYIVPK